MELKEIFFTVIEFVQLDLRSSGSLFWA